MDDQQTIKGGHAIIITFALCSNLARGVIIARVKGYGRYDLLGEAYRAMDATPPALEAQDLLVDADFTRGWQEWKAKCL